MSLEEKVNKSNCISVGIGFHVYSGLFTIYIGKLFIIVIIIIFLIFIYLPKKINYKYVFF